MKKSQFGIRLEISGDYALFSRPEMKTERVSYDVITPSAARGILEAIYWKPEIRWVIDEIQVLNPIRFTNIRRNEISQKIPVRNVTAAMAAGEGNLRLHVDENRQQRASLLLRDVRYIISAHFDLLTRRVERGGPELAPNEASGKHLDIFNRRARTGRVFHQPYFGCREFPVRFRLLEGDEAAPEPHESLKGERDLGYLLHDITFEQDRATKEVRSTTPHFFRATMMDGLIQVPPLNATHV